MPLSIQEIEQLTYTTTPIEVLSEEVSNVYSYSKPNSLERARSAVLMAIHCQRKREPSATFVNEAYKIAIEQDDKYVLADVYYLQSIDALQKSDLKQLSRLHQEALSAAVAGSNHYREAFSLYMLGKLAIRYGLHEDALNYFGQSQKIAEERGFLRLQTLILNNLAELTLTSHEFTVAREYALKAITVAERLSSAYDLHTSKIRLATIELELSNFDNAIKLSEAVAPEIPESNLPLRCTIEALRGEVYARQEKWSESESQLRIAIGLTQFPTGVRIRSNLHSLLSNLFEKQGKLDAAISEGLEALADASSADDSYQKKQALDILHRLYRSQGNILEAYKYLEEYNVLVSASDQALLKNRLEYHAVRNELEVERTRSEEGRRQSEMLRIELDHRERELTEKTRHLIKQTEAITQFRDELKAIIKRSPVTDPLVHEIKVRLKALPENELNWQDFDTQFKLVHPEFISKLGERYPELTPMERKICALLRLDLSSPEIAKLLFLSERNIQNHRYRLRKKLALSSDANIHEFLAKL
jgi:DNA-binding CsgD family transcriptional regulator